MNKQAGFLNSNKNLIYLFLAGLLLKIILGIFLASDFLIDFFAPFVNYFVESNFKNPYLYFENSSMQEAFPYPAFMLYLLALPRILLGWLDSTSQISFFDVFIYRIPLLIADTTIFLILYKWFKSSLKELLIFYWFSPVLIYISYIHGQLDVIPISLLFVSLYFLFKKRLLLTALFLGLSFCAKTHILLTFPFFIIYLFRQKIKFKEIILFFSIIVGLFLILNIPFIADKSFYTMIFHNREQGKIFDFYLEYNQNYNFYLIPSVLLLLLFKSILLKNYNKNIFIMFLGFAFGLLLIFIQPAQGWYYWLIPFLCYFYLKEKGNAYLLFLSLQGFYLLFFLVSKNSDYLQVFQLFSPDLASSKTLYAFLQAQGFNGAILNNIIFTFLQTTLALNCLWIYNKGLESFTNHKISYKPFLLGIGGDSGVGKTTIAKSLSDVFGNENITYIAGDDLHKWERGHEKWSEYTHLDPNANLLHKEINNLQLLKRGKKITRQYYDHSLGKFTSEQNILANKLIIYEGLHPFYIEKTRNLYDLKFFVNTEKQLAYHWKIIRDSKKRGYSKEKIIEQIERRLDDCKKYIDTQSSCADINVQILSKNIIKDLGNEKEQVESFIIAEIINSIFLEPLVFALEKIPTLSIKHYYDKNDKQLLEIDGEITENEINNLAKELIPGLEDIGINLSNWQKDQLGVIILILIYCIFEKVDQND